MAVTVQDSGTQAATPGTEHTLTTILSGEVLQLVVDINALAGAEVVELRIYGKVLSGGTERLLHRGTYGPGPQAQTMVMSVPIISPHHFRATLRQVGGSSRSFPWAVYKT